MQMTGTLGNSARQQQGTGRRLFFGAFSGRGAPNRHETDSISVLSTPVHRRATDKIRETDRCCSHRVP